MSYTHGKHRCTICHAAGRTTTIHEDRWRLIHWPAYWGDSQPDTLVLGFSMGANQIAAANSEPFDQVAFDGLRPRLQQVLDALGIRRREQTLEAAMSAHGRGLGFSSMARCSLGQWNSSKRDFVTSGSIMKDAPTDPWAGQVLLRCASTYLPVMPASVRRVVLLGLGDDYVVGVRQILRQVFDDFADINEVAFQAAGKVWVFAIHPSKSTGSHFKPWLTADKMTTLGRKRTLAQAAIARSYAEQDALQQPSRIGTRRLVKRNVV